MAPLEIKSRIIIPTRNGEREVQLCVGDITGLTQENKVDVILISALQGNYSKVKTSVIGALAFNLSIDVQKLYITHMKQDLRKNFNCWISKDLPAKSPYRQLICFEVSRLKPSIEQSVQDLFRGLMPIFNNQSKSVITPLLATGSQQASSRSQMMKVMIEAAVEWMRIGLPLQVFKIVVYAKDPNKIGDREQPCITMFETVKKVIAGQSMVYKEPAIKNDIFLVYNSNDEELVEIFKKSLKRNKNTKKIISHNGLMTQKDSWQHDIFVAMLSSARVVPVLSQSFLDDDACLDQYNIALCCNRYAHRNILTPICLERLTLPLYMGTVQWINCKERDTEKVHAASQTISENIKGRALTTIQKKYDVFISYCHRNVEKAKAILEYLQKQHPQLKIFFDYEELKTGVSWQQTLYNSLEASHCIVTLLSPDYSKSQVCQEEFNIALARHLSKLDNCLLIPVSIEKQNEPPTFCTFTCIDATAELYGNSLSVLADVIVKWTTKNVYNDTILGPQMEHLDIEVLQSQQRKQLFEKDYRFNSSELSFEIKSADLDNKINTVADFNVFISCSLHDQAYVRFLQDVLTQLVPGVKFNDKLKSSEAQISAADCLVVILSSKYISSSKEIEEMNLILSKERSEKAHSKMYCVRVTELKSPQSYIQLIHCDTCLTDELWEDFVLDRKSTGNDLKWTESLSNVLFKVEKEYQVQMKEFEVIGLLKVVCDLRYMLLSPGAKKKQPGLFLNIQTLNEEINTMDSLVIKTEATSGEQQSINSNSTKEHFSKTNSNSEDTVINENQKTVEQNYTDDKQSLEGSGIQVKQNNDLKKEQNKPNTKHLRITSNSKEDLKDDNNKGFSTEENQNINKNNMKTEPQGNGEEKKHNIDKDSEAYLNKRSSGSCRVL